MLKKITFAFLLSVFALNAEAYISGIAIQTDKDSDMHVYINGKLYNRQPGKFVRIKSLPGLFHVEVKVLNPYDKRWHVVRKDIRVKKGYEFYYRIVFTKGRPPQILEVKHYPVYSRYFLNPSLYLKNPVS